MSLRTLYNFDHVDKLNVKPIVKSKLDVLKEQIPTKTKGRFSEEVSKAVKTNAELALQSSRELLEKNVSYREFSDWKKKL